MVSFFLCDCKFFLEVKEKKWWNVGIFRNYFPVLLFSSVFLMMELFFLKEKFDYTISNLSDVEAWKGKKREIEKNRGDV